MLVCQREEEKEEEAQTDLRQVQKSWLDLSVPCAGSRDVRRRWDHGHAIAPLEVSTLWKEGGGCAFLWL